MIKKKSILFVGHCYYNHYYLSRELRKLGWRADVLNIDTNPSDQIFYHGEDFNVYKKKTDNYYFFKNIIFFIKALFRYRIFHFTNAEGFAFAPFNQILGIENRFIRFIFHRIVYKRFGEYAGVKILKFLRKKIIYTNNGCRDGVSQTEFGKWGPYSVCNICPWKNRPDVCSDEKNLKWGLVRNKYSDYIGILGSNRADFNTATHVHESPWMYSLDKSFWNPNINIPKKYQNMVNLDVVNVYHAVGNYDLRNHGPNKQTIKSTEIWIEIVNQLKSEGYKLEMIFVKDVPNKQVKYYQAQADIFLDMLTYGFFGANIREAMMLGKPAICYLRPQWLEDMSKEIPDYVKELPVISATPETAYETLKELIIDQKKRSEIGVKMREFGEKWHASDIAAEEADKIYKRFI